MGDKAKIERKFIGIDIDPKYVEITKKKLEEVEPTVINGCYVSEFLDRVIITTRDKDWAKIKSTFFIPTDQLELETKGIYLLYKKRKLLKPTKESEIQSNLLPLFEEKITTSIKNKTK